MSKGSERLEIWGPGPRGSHSIGPEKGLRGAETHRVKRRGACRGRPGGFWDVQGQVEGQGEV